jgi:hypothetical protein
MSSAPARGHASSDRRQSRKRFLLIAVYLAAVLPWIIPAAQRVLESNANSPLDWVQDDFLPRQQYDRFCRDFGAADSVVLSWPGCTVDNPSLDTLITALRSAPAFAPHGQSLFHQVTSGRELLAVMTGPPLTVPVEQAISRLQPWIVGADGQTTCVLIGFSGEGLKQRTRLVPLIRAAAQKYCNAAYQDQHLAGPIMDGYEVDVASRATTRQLAPLSSLAVLLVCYLCLDSLPATLLVFTISVLCQGLSLAAVELSGGTMTALLVVLPPLIQVLAIAGGIHFINYYFDARQSGDDQAALSRAFRIAWLPCLLSAATTAIGLGSLGVSGLVAVREFGMYAAVGVIVTTSVLLTLLYGFLQSVPLPVVRSRGNPRSLRAWHLLADWQARNYPVVCVVALLAMVGMGVGVTRLESSVRMETLFRDDSRLIRDYAWLEDHVGALVPIELVASVGPAAGSQDRELLRLLAELERSLREVGRVEAVLSPLSFLPPSAVAADDVQASRQLAAARVVAQRFHLRVAGADGRERWRTTAYVSALGNNDYVAILSELKLALQRNPVLQAAASRHALQWEVCGLMPLVHDIQQQLLRDLFNSFLTAFAMISVVMSIVRAGVWDGLLAMIPNVFPMLILFGLLGWLGRPLDIGSIMTASIAMGIAVDDTLHFLTFYQRELESGSARIDAVRSSYQHCGRAMIQTTMICCAGMAVFGFSQFVPTSGFGWMTALLLAAALVGDLIVLPALLLSPLGGSSSSRDRAADRQRGSLCGPAVSGRGRLDLSSG